MNLNYDPTISALLTPQSLPPLFDASTTYDSRMIAVEGSRLAYFRLEKPDQDRALVEGALRKLEFDRFAYLVGPEHGAQALITSMSAKGYALVAFRGTRFNSITDIATDIDLHRVRWTEGGMVHAGFAAALDEIWDDVEDWLRRNPADTVVITGHSLGGALATLCASRVVTATLLTFGSPRVGDQRFASLFENRSVGRFVDCCDVAAALPPRDFGFRHVAEKHYIDRTGSPLQAPTPDVIRDDRATARREYLEKYTGRGGNVPFRDLADHSLINYVSAVWGVRV